MFSKKNIVVAATSSLLVLSLISQVSGERKVMPKHTKDQHITSPLPYKLFTRSATYTSTPQMRTNGGNNKEEKLKLPRNFSWLTFQGVSYLTRSLNQHLPTYCGSCWAHAAVSVLADRIKIQRMLASSSALSSLSSSRVDSDSTYGTSTSDYGSDGLGYSFPDVYLSIQFILNCGGEVAGSCKGGSSTGAFQFIKEIGYIPYETCQPYMACSSDSDEELCKYIDTTCTSKNICKTCTRNASGVGVCNQISQFPNAKIDEYGVYKLKEANNIEEQVFVIKSEIAIRGPVAAAIAGHHLKNYTGGIIYDEESLRDLDTTHEVSIIGWDVDDVSGVEYWIIRNSWGEYWGEMSFFRLQLGSNMLGIESHVSWATIESFSVENEPCFEEGQNCLKTMDFMSEVISHVF